MGRMGAAPGGLVPKFRSGVYYGTPTAFSLGNTAFTLNQVQFTPIDLQAGRAFDRIGINVNASVASGTTRLGVYADDGFGAPGALLLDAGTVDTASTGDKEITISFTPASTGLFWLAAVAQGATATVKSHTAAWKTGGTSAAAVRIGFTQNSVSGALPNPAVPVLNANSSAFVVLRAA